MLAKRIFMVILFLSSCLTSAAEAQYRFPIVVPPTVMPPTDAISRQALSPVGEMSLQNSLPMPVKVVLPSECPDLRVKPRYVDDSRHEVFEESASSAPKSDNASRYRKTSQETLVRFQPLAESVAAQPQETSVAASRLVPKTKTATFSFWWLPIGGLAALAAKKLF